VSRSLVAVLVSLVLVACSGPGGGAGPLAWRDLDLVVPTGWMVLDQRDTLLLIANRDLRADDIEATPSLPQDPQANDAVAVQFTTDGTGADAWRELVEQEGGEIEADRQIQLDGLPATSITFNWVTNEVPTREQVVIVPSRELVILLQPVPVQGQQTGPDVYFDHVEEFEAVLRSIDFGAPEDAGQDRFSS
jgi:hypothetical protein